jgi:sugar lactone lactonase YvrE
MTGTTPIATYSNTGSVQLSLGNDPLIIQVGGPATVASNPPSPNDTVVKAGSAAAITDASGNTWTITSGAQVAVNGVTDAATSKVAELAYVNGTIWQETTAGLWSGETKPNDSWSTATTVSPLPVSTTSPPASPNDTVVLAGSTAAIIDASGNAWTITSGAQIAVNGVTDALTSQVTELAYVNGTIWQENTSNLWYGETKPNDSWSAGTTVSPLPTVSPPPTVITVPASEASVSVAVISSTINATSGNHTFLISGHADTFNLSGGVETITDSGSGGNTFKLPAAGSGSAIFNAAVLSDGDVFNLAAALSGTSWTGSSSTLGSYLHTLQSGANTELLVSAKATRHGTGTLLATFDNEKLSLSTILSHSVT